MSMKLFSCLSFITMSGLLAFISRCFFIVISLKIVMLSLSVTVWGSCSDHFRSLLRLYLALCICSSVGMRRPCHVCVCIQFWPAQGTLPRYDQWFPGIIIIIIIM